MKFNLSITALSLAFCVIFASAAVCTAQNNGGDNSLITSVTYKGTPSVRSARFLLAANAKPGKAIAPEVVVRNLYAAHKANRGPFFQVKSRALVDKYFTKDFADLIWKDRIDAGNEAGYIDFDPLFAAQDVHIKNFKIGTPEPGEGNLKLTDVPVTFKNMGKSQTILFRLLQGPGRVWRISDIFYPEKDAPIPSLKNHLMEFVGK